MSELLDDVAALLELALEEEPTPGHAFWSFHVKDRPGSLDEDEIVERIESGVGVYAIEIVLGDDLEPFQRGSGRKIKSHADLRALLRRRGAVVLPVPVSRGGPTAPLTAPPLDAPRGTTPLHGAFLSAPSSARPRPRRRVAQAAAALSL